MSVRQTKWSTRPGASNNRTNKYREAARLHSERCGGGPSLASRSPGRSAAQSRNLSASVPSAWTLLPELRAPPSRSVCFCSRHLSTFPNRSRPRQPHTVQSFQHQQASSVIPNGAAARLSSRPVPRDAPPRSRRISPSPCPLLGRCYRNSALLHLVPFASARGTDLLFRIDAVRGSLTRSKASNTNKRAPSFRTERRPALSSRPVPGTRRRAVEESLRLRALCLDAATGTPRSNPSIADWPRQSALLSSPVPMS